MFVEKLTMTDIKTFLENRFGKIETLIPNLFVFDNPIYYVNNNDKIVFCTEYVKYTFTDFEFVSCAKHGTINPEINNKSWLKFMYNKFGDEYKKEFLKMREAKKESQMRKYENSYDNETKKLEEGFTK